VAAFSLLMGLISLISTQYLAKDAFRHILKACKPPPPPSSPPVVSSADVPSSTSSLSFLFDRFQDTLFRPRHQSELLSGGYIPYIPVLGGNVACIKTQFLHRVIISGSSSSSPSSSSSSSRGSSVLGWMVLLANASVVLPLVALVLVESGKQHHHHRHQKKCGLGGLAGWVAGNSTLVLLVSHLWGASFAVPFVWLPAYLFSPRADDYDDDNGERTTRTKIAVVPNRNATMTTIISGLVLIASGSVLVLVVPPLTAGWAWIAAALVGPAAALIPLWINKLLGRPRWSSSCVSSSSRVALASTAYGTAGALSFCLWSAAVFAGFASYGVDHKRFLQDLMTVEGSGNDNDNDDPDDHRASLVLYLIADAVGAYITSLLYLSHRSILACLEAMLQTLIFGPGAATSMMLARLEHYRSRSFTQASYTAKSSATGTIPEKNSKKKKES
jgi:hypothetical protein